MWLIAAAGIAVLGAAAALLAGGSGTKGGTGSPGGGPGGLPALIQADPSDASQPFAPSSDPSGAVDPARGGDGTVSAPASPQGGTSPSETAAWSVADGCSVRVRDVRSGRRPHAGGVRHRRPPGQAGEGARSDQASQVGIRFQGERM